MVEPIGEATTRYGRPVPVIKGRWPLGCLRQIHRDPLNFFMNVGRLCGDVAEIRVGGDRLLLVTDPDIIEHILDANHRNYVKSRFFMRLAAIFGYNVIISDGEIWRRQRRMVQPAFTTRHVDSLDGLIRKAAAGLTTRWREAARLQVAVDVLEDCMDTALQVVVQAVFGLDIGARADALSAALTEMLMEGERRLWLPFSYPGWLPSPSNRRLGRAMARFDAAIHSLIAERRAAGGERDDILGAFLAARDEAGQPMTDQQIRDEIAGVIVAGHETTGSALAWTLEALSRFPAIELRLRAEIGQVLGGRPATIRDQAVMPYCRAVLMETMRLRPPVWTMSREAVADDQIKGLTLPAGTAIMMSQHVVHRDARFWPNPEGFDPERFLGDGVPGRFKYAYFPFGGGPRRCLGANFSLSEMSVILPTILQGLKLSLIPGHPVQPKAMVTLRPEGGMWMAASAIGDAPQRSAA